MSPATGSAPFSASTAQSVLRAASEVARLDSTDARLLRMGENALFQLPNESLVVRIGRTMDYLEDATKEVSVSRWLADSQFPAARVSPIEQPITVSGHPVTLWIYINGRNGGRQDIAQLGALLRRLHGMPAPTEFSLPAENILGRVHKRIERASVSRKDKEFLLKRFSDLESELSSLQYPLELAPTHGDAHVQNLMVSAEQTLLIDFERFAYGHPEWDLSMTATEYQTAGWWTDAEYQSFTEAYGYDVMSWTEGFPVLRAVHEIKMTTWLMQNVNESPEIAREYENRMRTIRNDELDADWHPF